MSGLTGRLSLLSPPSVFRMILGIAVALVGFPAAVIASMPEPMTYLAGMPFVAVIIATTALGRLALGSASVVIATLLLDYYVIPPIGSLNTERASDYVAVVVFFGVSLGTSVTISHVDRVNEERKRANARLQYIATSLQRTLLPARLPEIASVDIAVGYWPAGDGIEVGGDFYDVFQPDGDRIVFVIGDVAGKGPEAAAYVGAARHIVRTLAAQNHAPADLLSHVNKFLLEEMSGGQFCTVCISVLDVSSENEGVLTIASAGHPRPVILRRDGTTERAAATGTLLGLLEGVVFDEYSTRLHSGDTLALYTDGLYERPPRSRATERDVSSLFVGVPAMPVRAALRRVEDVLKAESLMDDAALVLVRRR